MARDGGRSNQDQPTEWPEPAPLPGDPSPPANHSQRNQIERRVFPRYTVDCPVTVTAVAGAGQMSGHLSDLSLGGCLIRLKQRYLAGMLVRVEVQFQLRGITFRMLGVTVGTRGAQSFAVRFLDVPARRREELAATLDEVATIEAARVPVSVAEEKTSTVQELPAATAGLVQMRGPDESTESAIRDQPKAAEQLEATPDETKAEAVILRQAASPSNRERRVHGRHKVDTRVKLLLIRSSIAMKGRIANLSMGGCLIRTDERFNVGIFVRIEAEFYLHGLPFRIAGVSQAIQDKYTIGIRFLDMSQRCRAQLVELIAEIEEVHALEKQNAARLETGKEENTIAQ